MRLVYFAQTHLAFAVGPSGNEAQTFAFGFQALTTRFKFGIEPRELFPKLLERTFEERIGDEEVCFDVFHVDAVATFARKDCQFANNIFSREIDAWIGFTVALLLRHAHRFRKRNIGTQRVEHKIECAAHHSLDAQHFVARTCEVVDGVDDRKPRPNVGFKEVFHSAFPSGVLQEFVAIEIG